MVTNLSKAGTVAPGPKVIHHGLRGGEEVPSPGEHARRHGNLFSKKRVPQTRVERHLSTEGKVMERIEKKN